MARSPDGQRGLLTGMVANIPLVLLLVWLFRDCLFRGWVAALPPGVGDVPDQFLPWRVFVSEQIARGEIPLWNRFSFCGAPFLANMQSTVLYPIDRLLDLLFSPAHSLMVGFVLHLWAGGFFLYLLARNCGASAAGASVASIGYTLGGFHAIHLFGGNLLTITSSIYLPAHLLAVKVLGDRIERHEPVGWVPLLAVCAATLQILSGHAQMTFYNAVFVLVFLIGFLVQMKERRIHFLLVLAGIGLTAAFLAAPQIVPTLEYTRYSSRTGPLPYLAATEFSFGWEFLLSFLLPEYLGTRADAFSALGRDTFWGDWKNWSAVYIGVLPIFGWFSLFGPNRHRSEGWKLLALWGGLLLVALFLSLGRNTPVYSWFHHYVPLFGKFRHPSKFLPGLVAPVAIIGAVGVSRWIEDCRGERSAKGIEKAACLSLGGIVCLLAVAWLPALAQASSPAGLGIRDLLRSAGFLALAISGLYAILSSIGKEGVHQETRSRWTVCAPLLFAAILSGFDMGWYFKKYAISAPPEAVQLFPSEFVRGHLREGERVLATGQVPQLAACIPEGIPTVGGYDPFQVGCYVEEFRRAGTIDREWIPDSWSPPVSWAKKLGAGLVLSSGPIEAPGIAPLAKEGRWFLFRVDEPAPFLEFKSTSTDPGNTESSSPSWRWEGQRLLVEGNAPTDGYLLVRQTFLPGWVARSGDGLETKVEMEEPFWQRFPVPKGNWDLVLSYEPWGWKVGMRLFPLGVVGLIAWGAAGTGSVRKRRPSAST